MKYHPEMFSLEDINNRSRLRGVGGHPRKFSYTFQNIADILDLEVDTVRRMAKKGIFNPNSLLSTCKFIIKRKLAIDFHK